MEFDFIIKMITICSANAVIIGFLLKPMKINIADIKILVLKRNIINVGGRIKLGEEVKCDELSDANKDCAEYIRGGNNGYIKNTHCKIILEEVEKRNQ